MLTSILLLGFHAALLQGGAPSVPAVASPLWALNIYSGSWTITGASTLAGAGKPDHVDNHCHLVDAFYTCEQVVNGKPQALIVFTPGDSPDTFHTQIVLPDGHATGRGDLTRRGERWTWDSKTIPDPTGKPPTWYRTENYFTGRDIIHYEQFESADGVAWKKTASGDEQREGADTSVGKPKG